MITAAFLKKISWSRPPGHPVPAFPDRKEILLRRLRAEQYRTFYYKRIYFS